MSSLMGRKPFVKFSSFETHSICNVSLIFFFRLIVGDGFRSSGLMTSVVTVSSSLIIIHTYIHTYIHNIVF